MNLMQYPEIAVIIVNYNTAALSLEAVESVLARNHGDRKVEVHLVDNASPAGDAAVLAREICTRGWSGRVTLYPEAENHGFGRGNNLVLRALAARETPPTYVFLLNPDARLANDAIAVLADFLDTHHKAAAAGARIEKPGNIPVTAAFRFPGVISTFSGALAFGPVARALSKWRVPLPPHMPTSRVDWVSGAAVMLRFSVAQDINFFDPSFFLYFEETDLMHRMTKRGAEVWHVADARIIHAEGAATDVKSGRAERRRLPAYWYQSWLYYFRKHFGHAGALLAASAWILGAVFNRLITALRGRPATYPRQFFADFWAVVVRPLLGLRTVPYD